MNYIRLIKLKEKKKNTEQYSAASSQSRRVKNTKRMPGEEKKEQPPPKLINIYNGEEKSSKHEKKNSFFLPSGYNHSFQITLKSIFTEKKKNMCGGIKERKEKEKRNPSKENKAYVKTN